MQPPDRVYEYPVTGRAQIRTELGITKGDVDWFMVQLEYNHQPHPARDDDWEQVARFDHHPHMSWGHDIRKEGLHCDIYEHGERAKREYYYPDFPVNDAPRWCQEHFELYADHYLAQYEVWHGVVETQPIE